MLGDNLRLLRLERRLIPVQVADAVGVSLLAIKYYEANTWQPGKQIISKLADFFGVTTEQITESPTLLYDEENHETLIVRYMGGNHIRVISRLQDKSHRIERKEVDRECCGN
jgi:transcriptional regulator with XRE-family HTH domain